MTASLISAQANELPRGKPRGIRPMRAGDYSFNHIGITSMYMLLSTIPEEVRKEKGFYTGLPMELYEYEHDMGCRKLLSTCESYSTVPIPGETIHVFIFDRDERDVTNKVNDGTHFKQWSPRVFSFSIPVTNSTKTR
jgi:hypothetical protein